MKSKHSRRGGQDARPSGYILRNRRQGADVSSIAYSDVSYDNGSHAKMNSSAQSGRYAECRLRSLGPSATKHDSMGNQAFVTNFNVWTDYNAMLVDQANFSADASGAKDLEAKHISYVGEH